MSIELASAPLGRPQSGGAPRPRESGEHEDRWGFEEGDEIAGGLHAVRALGGGTRYEAYLAWVDDRHCLVVAKVLRPESVTSCSALDGLAREAHVLERLQHPGLLRCFGAVLDGPRPHLVLEFLEGPRLSTLLRRFGSLAPEQLGPLALQLCATLHYMGTREMLHLDVKPQNIIMGPVARLIDLSIARTFAQGRTLDEPVGTDAYMAPEQCDPRAAGGVGPEADVWGLGATLYEATASTRPFRSDAGEFSSAPPWPQLKHDPTPFPEQVPVVLAQLIYGCLERRPEDRPRPAELASSLETIVAALPRRPVLGRLKPKLR
jgi:serine/threonine protein kinase